MRHKKSVDENVLSSIWKWQYNNRSDLVIKTILVLKTITISKYIMYNKCIA